MANLRRANRLLRAAQLRVEADLWAARKQLVSDDVLELTTTRECFWCRQPFETEATGWRATYCSEECRQHLPQPLHALGGWVYLIAGGGKVKVGRSIDPTARLGELRRMSPVPLSLLAVASGGFRAETRLHRRLAGQRAHGEWFDVAPAGALAAMREECEHVEETWEASLQDSSQAA